MKQFFMSLTLLMLASLLCLPAFGTTAPAAEAPQQHAHEGHAMAANDKDFPKLAQPGEKVPLGADHYFTYGFTKQPKLGTAIMKVEIFTQAGKPDASFVVKGSMDMPSMRGMHSTGAKEFSISKNGAYLLPAEVAMPGDWEFRFTFEKDGKTVFRGAYLFDI